MEQKFDFNKKNIRQNCPGSPKVYEEPVLQSQNLLSQQVIALVFLLF